MVYPTAPQHSSYDVVIIGGAMMGSSTAWWLTRNPDFKGRVLVVERDPSYEFASTSHTNSCIRQQFSSDINIRISQFGAEFVNGFRSFMGDDAPDIPIRAFGYMYLADTPEMAATLRETAEIQQALGAGTRIWEPDEIAAEYPFYNLDGILCGCHNLDNEGYFDGGTVFDWFKKRARAQGAEFISNVVTAIARDGDAVKGVTLADGTEVGTDKIVNASGPRAALTAQMAGLDVPVEPRRRFTYIFSCPDPLPRDLPLTIDPTGVHMRWDGQYYLCGCPPMGEDNAMDPADFSYEDGIWEEKLWPAVANRVPVFERARVENSWVGHYAFNTLDQNAIIGPHTEVENF
ncbi:MAG: FAD-binding oxidoreductase, partial [Pseudomonadota bacterium]